MEFQEDVQAKESVELKEPSLYKVVLLNDDYTTMEFVIDILTNIFSLSSDEAVAVMMKVHERGRGVCGIYTYEIAETKVARVAQQARANNFPLRSIIEEV